MGKSFDFSKIDEIVANHENSAVNIIAILQDIQEYYHYLPREIFEYIAKKLDTKSSTIYSVATFYPCSSRSSHESHGLQNHNSCHRIQAVQRIQNQA